MEKTSHLLLLSITLFLSTFFVGCKPQEEPIALEDINLESTKKIAEKTSSVEEAVQIEQQQSAENQFEFTDTVESTTNVVLKGYAFLSTGFPVTNGFFVDVVQAKESKVKTFSCKIRPEIDGSITISNLMLGNAELQFSLPGCNSLKTNIYLTLPVTELEITFQENPMAKITGIVLREQDNKPVEGVTVKAHVWREGKPYNSCITDKNGKFSLALQELRGFLGEIMVDDHDYGKVIKRISYGTTFVKIILRQSGEAIGKVMTESKKPVPGITISLRFMNFTGTSNNNLKNGNDSTSYTTVSDSKGNYKFSSVIAPAKYRFEIDDLGFTLPNCFGKNAIIIEVKPDNTTVRDLIVQKNTIVAIKAKDYHGYPVLEYELTCRMRYNDDEGHSTIECIIDLSDDDWYYVRTNRGGSGKLSCIASEDESSLSLITNNISFSGKGTNYITLIFPYLEPNITGYILNPDGSPAKNCNVSISYKRDWIYLKADDTGYFVARGLNVKKGELIKITASSKHDNSNIRTNLTSGSKEVELTLLQPCKITGRVFLNNLNIPAKSIKININNSRVGGKHSNDGVFNIFMNDFSLKKKKTGTITISVKGYSSEKFEYDFSNKNICDLGDIILKFEPEK